MSDDTCMFIEGLKGPASPFPFKFRPFSGWRLGESNGLCAADILFVSFSLSPLFVSVIPRTSRRLSIGVFPFYPM